MVKQAPPGRPATPNVGRPGNRPNLAECWSPGTARQHAACIPADKSSAQSARFK